MDVNVEFLIKILFDAELFSMGPRVAHRRLGRLFHHVAELPGEG